MLKMSTQLPLPPTIPDNQELADYLTALKQYCEELARKAQNLQMEIRTAAPGVDDLDEGGFVRATVGGLNYIYTKKGGTVLRWQIT